MVRCWEVDGCHYGPLHEFRVETHCIHLAHGLIHISLYAQGWFTWKFWSYIFISFIGVIATSNTYDSPICFALFVTSLQ